ncbi:hypothetical protein BKA66DRAFT_568124 [Pyrenochaeta sp. MPI-SDFR-AT-0127]|nr:hypothetical protein BKA66DRAFT_568124 [Pyrenochaeta sp. MPI-SDFR-AT-0127]
MDQETTTLVIRAIQALDSKIGLLNQLFDKLERRMTNVEEAIVHLNDPNSILRRPATASGYTTAVSGHQSLDIPFTRPLPSPLVIESSPGVGRYSANLCPAASQYHIQQPFPGTRTAWYPSRGAIGSSENVTFLPYVIEAIAQKYQKYHQKYLLEGGYRKCACGALSFSIDCFRYDHFRWCRTHHRPIIKPHEKCGRDYEGCQSVKWENHAEWESIVQQSFSGGFLGRKSVGNLREWLFPQDLFPQKYKDGRYIQ